jgi:hypothetical protein
MQQKGMGQTSAMEATIGSGRIYHQWEKPSAVGETISNGSNQLQFEKPSAVE